MLAVEIKGKEVTVEPGATVSLADLFSISTYEAPDDPRLPANSGLLIAFFSGEIDFPSEPDMPQGYETFGAQVYPGNDFSTRSIVAPLTPGNYSFSEIRGSAMYYGPPGTYPTYGTDEGAPVYMQHAVLHVTAPVTISIVADAPTVTTRDGYETTAAFAVTLSRVLDYPVSISYATHGGSAIEGEDYVGQDGVLTFAAGETRNTISIAIKGEALNLPDKTFHVTLTNPSSSGGTAPTISSADALETIHSEVRQEPVTMQVGEVTVDFDGNTTLVIDAYGDVLVTAGGDRVDEYVHAFSTASPEEVPLPHGGGIVYVYREIGIGIQVFDSAGHPLYSTGDYSQARFEDIVIHYMNDGTYDPESGEPIGHSHKLDDSNGDGISDILFTNGASDYQWEMDGRVIAAANGIDQFDDGFSVQVRGDFDGDGKSDILFEDPSNGGVYEWGIDGALIAHQGPVDVADAHYRLLGTADFNGDGTSDVLWRSDQGHVYLWQMFGKSDIGSSVGPLALTWHIVGAGDFNGDGRADILLRDIDENDANDNGAFYLWEMNGNQIEAQGGIERPGTDWRILGVGDFDGDGKSDFAVRHAASSASGETPGAVWVYLMDGTTIKAQGAAGIADPATWRVQEIGDLNGDGKDDILFRNDVGYFYSWEMNGTTIASEGLLHGVAAWADPNFSVVGQHWDVI